MAQLRIDCDYTDGGMVYKDKDGNATSDFHIPHGTDKVHCKFSNLPSDKTLWVQQNVIIPAGTDGLTATNDLIFDIGSPAAGDVALFEIASAEPNWTTRARDIVPCMVVDDDF